MRAEYHAVFDRRVGSLVYPEQLQWTAGCWPYQVLTATICCEEGSWDSLVPYIPIDPALVHAADCAL